MRTDFQYTALPASSVQGITREHPAMPVAVGILAAVSPLGLAAQFPVQKSEFQRHSGFRTIPADSSVGEHVLLKRNPLLLWKRNAGQAPLLHGNYPASSLL